MLGRMLADFQGDYLKKNNVRCGLVHCVLSGLYSFSAATLPPLERHAVACAACAQFMGRYALVLQSGGLGCYMAAAGTAGSVLEPIYQASIMTPQAGL